MKEKLFRFADLFSGIGGLHLAAAAHGGECVFACDINAHARRAYQENFGITPEGDITKIDTQDVPDHDLLCAGFPCQPFSVIGSRRGFDDDRGNLFFEIIRILKDKRPPMVVLENVKQLATHDNGKTLCVILQNLDSLGYRVHHKILNALDYGVPQKRERVILVGFLNHEVDFHFPQGEEEYAPLSQILEQKVDQKHYASLEIVNKRKERHRSSFTPSIWHENKSGNISSYPYSCALRAVASYNYLLVNGERRLTPREMLRLQGFPDSFKIICSDSQTRRQAGNSIPVPMLQAVIGEMINFLPIICGAI